MSAFDKNAFLEWYGYGALLMGVLGLIVGAVGAYELWAGQVVEIRAESWSFSGGSALLLVAGYIAFSLALIVLSLRVKSGSVRASLALLAVAWVALAIALIKCSMQGVHVRSFMQVFHGLIIFGSTCIALYCARKVSAGRNRSGEGAERAREEPRTGGADATGGSGRVRSKDND